MKRKAVQREILALKKIDHPNIINVLDSYEDDHKYYFVINEIKGGSLFDRIIEYGNLEESAASSIGAYLVSITRYLHKNGVIMRNIKPETILFEEKHETKFDLKLVDLSLSIHEEEYIDGDKDPVFEEFHRFSPVFLAPELFSLKKKYSF